MRVVPREVAARRLKMTGLSDPLRNEPRFQSIERPPGLIQTRKAQRVLVQPAPYMVTDACLNNRTTTRRSLNPSVVSNESQIDQGLAFEPKPGKFRTSDVMGVEQYGVSH
jgi:hypothetical protein